MKTIINIKTDKDVKQGIQKIAKKIGLPVSTIVNAYFKQLLREKRVSFSLPTIPNKKTSSALRKAHHDYKRNKNISPVFKNVGEMDVYLDS